MIRAVLFDFYDTLAHVTGEAILAGRRAMAERAGVDPERMAALWRDTAEQRMLGTLGTLENEIAALLRRLDLTPTPDLLRDLAQLDLDAWQRAVTLYADARPALETLKARGYRLGVLSNCSHEAGYVIEQAGLDDVFEALALSFRLGVAKPDPAIYHSALQMLHVAPSEAVFVADGAFGELDAARALGIVAVLIEQEHQSRAYGGSTTWDYRVERLAEVPPLVDRLGQGTR
ncbi:MAG TPA: HAD family hydrolase [Chloroflexota bacterium]|jgi:putative hydrolase of the HAD superfamily